MINTITVSVPFSFKGQEYEPSLVIDLNDHSEGFDSDKICLTIAHENGIGLYSYELEVMQSNEMVYSNATGLATKFLKDGCFDFEAYSVEFQQVKTRSTLEKISKDVLSIDDLDAEPAIHKALLMAYNAGVTATPIKEE